MATLAIQGSDLCVCLTGLEKLAAMYSGVRVPLSAVSTIAVEPNPWGALRGIRAPGTGIPGVIAYGVRRATGARPDFAALHGRGPAIRVELGPMARFERLLITVADPAGTVAAVTRGTGR